MKLVPVLLFAYGETIHVAVADEDAEKLELHLRDSHAALLGIPKTYEEDENKT